MLRQPLISVIVPIYNVEKYLQRCIDSIINQTLKDIEIILVNDGSTDNCGNIIDEYAKQDERIVAIHKENGGQSSARNIGLDIAKGKYVGFVDSDDWISNDMYELLYKSITEDNYDIAVCGRSAYSSDNKMLNEIKIKDEKINLEEISLQNYVASKLFYSHTVVVWNKLYSKDIIDTHKIRFEDVSYVGSEDALFNYQVLCHVKKIRAIDKVCYSQLSREDSTARTYKAGYMNRTANMVSCMNRYGIKIGKLTESKDIINMFLVFFYQWNISQIKLHSKYNALNLVKEELKESLNNTTFRNSIKLYLFDSNISRYMKLMGFRSKGILLIKSIMALYYLKCYKLASKIIVSV